MRFFDKNSFDINSVMATLLCVIVLSYFAFHAINGDRGFIALVNLSQKVEKSRTELDSLKAQRLNLEHKVSMLRDDSLDLDLLDEQARAVLGYANKSEILYNKD